MFVLPFGSLDVSEDVWACFTLEVPTVRSLCQESSKVALGQIRTLPVPCCTSFWLSRLLNYQAPTFAAYGINNGALYAARERFLQG